MFWYGFCWAVIATTILFSIMFASGKVAQKVKTIFEKVMNAWCTVVFTLSAIIFTLLYSAVASLLSNAVLGSLVCAVLLVISWCIEEKLYQVLTGEKKAAEQKTLTKEDKSACHVCALGGVALSGVIFGLENGNNEYTALISIAISIWIGAYIPIADIFEGKRLRDVRRKIKEEFQLGKGIVWISGGITALVVALSVSKKNFVQEGIRIIEKFGVGMAVGACVVPCCIVLWELLKRRKEKKKSDSMERNNIV